jgi:hypothetical protein
MIDLALKKKWPLCGLREGAEGHCGRGAGRGDKISHQGVSDVLKGQRRV